MAEYKDADFNPGTGSSSITTGTTPSDETPATSDSNVSTGTTGSSVTPTTSDSNLVPSRGAYHAQGQFRFWCQKVLPLVYDDSLSYYELLCKVVDYLNKTMQNVAVLEEDVTETNNQFANLQTFVNETVDKQAESFNQLQENLNADIEKQNTAFNELQTNLNNNIKAQNDAFEQFQTNINGNIEKQDKAFEDLQTYTNDEIAKIRETYLQLQQYVNDYFNNLDVQEEINNKLDDMAENGTLTDIIRPLVLQVAVPLFVDSTDKMSDHGRVYVLTTTGHVYTWNGSEFTDTGFVYNGNLDQYFGLNSTLATESNLDEITESGAWNLAGSYTYTNSPIATGLLRVFTISGVTYQIATEGTGGEQFFRRKLATGWESWSQYAIRIRNFLPSGTDLNTVTTTGIYNCPGDSEYSNRPTGSGLLEVYNMSNNVVYQFYTNGTTGEVFFRRILAGTAEDWKTPYDLHPYSIEDKSQLADNTDLNDVTDRGFWIIGSNASYTNSPVTSGFLMVSHIGGIVTQMIIRYDDLGFIYTREYHTSNNTWRDWHVIRGSQTLAMRDTLPNGTDYNDMVSLDDIGWYNLNGDYTYSNQFNKMDGQFEVFYYSGVTYQIVFSRPEITKPYIAFRWHLANGWSDWTVNYNVPKTYSDVYHNGLGIQRLKNEIVINSFESGFYSTVNGQLSSGTTFVRSKALFKVKEYRGYYIDSDSELRHQLVFYDDNYNYLGYCKLDHTVGFNPYPTVAPAGATYGGLNYEIGDGEAPVLVTIHEVDGSKLLTIGKDLTNCNLYYDVKKGVISEEGTFTSSDSYTSIFIPNPKCSKIFTNYDALHTCLCINSSGENVSPTEYEQITPIGRVYTIPENTVLIGMSLRTAETDSPTYVTLIREPDYDSNVKSDNITPLSWISGKRVAAIGDSLTYIDGRNYGGQTRLVGWPSYIRMLGATVQNFGYSGYAYAKTTESDGITDTIVDGNIDMSSYDIAILFGGANDTKLNVTIGNENTDYSNPNVSDETFIGAIGKLITYLRTQNPKMIIFICTMAPSQDSTRTFDKATQYNNAIKHCGLFWQVPIIDIYNNMNVHPNQNFSTYFYDNTHPNALGSERIGKIVGGFINNYLSIGTKEHD